MKKLLVALSLLAAGSTRAEIFEVKNPKRVVKLVGGVDGSTLALAQRIEKLSRTPGDIDMLINSPGGSVTIGMMVVDAIKAAQQRGVKFRCASAVMAASMGFILLAECDERYVLPNARLLFHPVSFGTQRARVQEIVPDLLQTIAEEQLIMKRLNGIMGLPPIFFHQHYFAETFWPAHLLARETADSNFLNVVTDIQGFGDSLLKYKKKSIFGFKKSKGIQIIIERFERGGR